MACLKFWFRRPSSR